MKIKSRFLIRTAARLIAILGRLLYSTVRFTKVPQAPGISPYEDNGDARFLYCVWHDAILGMLFSQRCLRMAGLVSRHEDGSYVADAMECVGVKPIRGSSSKGGAAALRQMMDAARDHDIAIATDGPRGPRRVVKNGIVFLASQTGRPILCVGYACVRAWRPRGKWTDMEIPKPFSASYIVGAPPIHVPPRINRDQIEQFRQQVQRTMDEANAIAERLARGEMTLAEAIASTPPQTLRAAA